MVARRRLLLLAGLVLAGVAEARIPRHHRLRMDGYVGAPIEGRREQADLVFGYGKQDVRFQVTKAVLLSGDGVVTRIFDRVRMYKPNFILRGPEAVLRPLVTAPPGTRLRIIGVWVGGSRDFQVASVDPG